MAHALPSYAKNPSPDPADLPFGLGRPGRFASAQNPVCRRNLDQSCQEARVLADWYSRLGIETKEMYGGYYGSIETAAGQFVFGIHPKKKDAPQKSSASVAIVLRVENSKRPWLP